MARRPAARTPRTPSRRGRLTLDEALIVVMIAAMNANQHVSREELARAHHIIWSMRRFRRRDGAEVGRLIDRMRERIEADGPSAAIDDAARVIPARLRPAVFAITADLVQVDGTLQREERRFLGRLAGRLEVPAELTRGIMKVIAIKNSV